MTLTNSDRAGVAAQALTPTARQRARRSRGWLAAASAIFAAALLALVLVGQSAQQSPPLDPTSSTPTGAKALLTVLGEHGVDVRTATTLAAAQRAAAGTDPDGVTVAIYDPNGYLSLTRLAKDAELDTRFVLIAPADGAEQPLVVAGREVRVAHAASAFENGSILNGANAGNAIRLLGATPVLIWYTPTIADESTGAPATIADLTPPWVTPVIVLGALAAAAAAVWRGRRFGPLVVEDLAVIVRASESLEGRARLYQRFDARLHALDALRMGAVGRLAKRLGLGPSASVTSVCDAVGAELRRDSAEVRAVLLDAVPHGDRDFLELARRVRMLESAFDHQPSKQNRPPTEKRDQQG